MGILSKKIFPSLPQYVRSPDLLRPHANGKYEKLPIKWAIWHDYKKHIALMLYDV